MSAWASSTSSVSWDGYQEWESYYQSLARDFRHSLRRTRRRLAQRGNLSFEAVTNHEQFQPIIDWLFSHKTEWIVKTKQRSPWQNAELYKKFIIEVMTGREGGGNITLFVLKVDGQITSAALIRISKFSAEGFIAAFDRSYSKYGVGQLLYEDILKWAFEQRLDFDFRIGDQAFKKRWTNHESKVITYQIVNSIWGTVFFWASRCRSKLRSLRHSLLP
jgi:CelD/BcsL family acetyltransferase involved in cellulose biosynthesis